MPSDHRVPTTARRAERTAAVDAAGLRTALIPRRGARRFGRIRMFDEFRGYPAIPSISETAEYSGTDRSSARHRT
ncbi:hypothetical protein GCM10027271_13170 [Saccharopolyspora gloriosae]|uniref:Uncharacterized protein n=1 Tax=Saccharopolyspora gloriosae TaxID=455344 RepID=A0A840NMR9_9PSEU|nr:hypothetical protein [Saccharopolyspora gloriosae]MBB5072854.1 hypothetical protein [Saccharopolyspora gloriosae]